ncbi:MAG TPA: glycosyltransferase [Candidatus Limnocylindrales bacterium]|nr:glycosyltransferase [Candidatus Limnocylindrales bacterium]
MRTYIIQYDLSRPSTPIWGLEGYQQAFVLVRNGRRPLGILYLTLSPWQVTLSHRQLEQAIADQLNISPEEQTTYARRTEFTCDLNLPISIVVCTRDRAYSLRQCLKALSRLEYKTYEVIVVDNASRDQATAEVVSETPFRSVREDRPGLNWARNRGIAEAQYDIIAYVDDDVRVDPGWLQGVATAFADPQVSAMTGLVLPAELETPAQHLFEQYGGMGKGMLPRQFQRETLRPQDLIAVHAVGVGANMAFRRNVFEIVGNFDTALDVGTPARGGGDLDMFHRILTAGLTLRYEPTALVWHQHRRDMDGLRQQLYNNGCAFGVYLIKVWRRGQVGRGKVLHFALWQWIVGWLLNRLVKGLLRRHTFPLRLVWAELWGMLHAPWTYFATYRYDRKVRSNSLL